MEEEALAGAGKAAGKSGVLRDGKESRASDAS